MFTARSFSCTLLERAAHQKALNLYFQYNRIPRVHAAPQRQTVHGETVLRNLNILSQITLRGAVLLGARPSYPILMIYLFHIPNVDFDPSAKVSAQPTNDNFNPGRESGSSIASASTLNTPSVASPSHNFPDILPDKRSEIRSTPYVSRLQTSVGCSVSVAFRTKYKRCPAVGL